MDAVKEGDSKGDSQREACGFGAVLFLRKIAISRKIWVISKGM
jgi:hypothetical protein